MGSEMFWGGAPLPLTKDPDALRALNEFENGPVLTREDSDSEVEYYNPQIGESFVPKRRETTPQDAPKRRVTGGMAAVAKPIVADYDSDDARIIELKQNSYSDQYVADKLVEEGRVRYVPKTIGSRWLRLRRTLEEREDERLDDELSDWHVGEDEQLAAIKQDVDKKFEAMIERLKSKMWNEVSQYLAQKMEKRKYTAKACRERYEANTNGTALLPIELDPDQAGRRKLREARVAKAKADRAAYYTAIQEADEAKKAKAEAKKQAKLDSVIRRQTEQAQKKAERVEWDCIKQERLHNRAKAHYLRAWRLAQMRNERDWEMEKMRLEKTVYKKLTGSNLFGKAGGAKESNKNEYESDDESDDQMVNDMESDEESEAEMSDLGSDGDDNLFFQRTDSVVAGTSEQPARKRRIAPLRKAKQQKGKGKSTGSKGDAAEQAPAPAPKALISKQTLMSPRSIMTDNEIAALLHSRELPRRMKDESHAQVIARLFQADESLKRDELDDLLRHASEKTSGVKAQKIHRLQLADAAKSVGGELGLDASDPEFMSLYSGYRDPEWKWVLDEALEEAGMPPVGGGNEEAEKEGEGEEDGGLSVGDDDAMDLE